ncbi:structural maintenance of chromosomes protein 4-like [Convolutriloba macropyga]|uniref:structural maintenance of chromosomes protein 4-like n=1 Tax=Convolutriloba macropyga TaxID=536237 RepID=UPI003F51E7A1
MTGETNEPKPRLIIRKLSLENFKSYGGTVELGPFHKKFCCIVGPNGSGKSNVIDALLFVFGFRAAKIRLKKLSMLIHNSDESCRSIQSCSVAVHFADIIDSATDPDDFTIVEGSELVISRSAYRDNSSNYYINGRKSNYKEVRDLLKSKAVDLDHNRFLILQGEVEQISQMKPKGLTEHDEGLLEYLEDIIGTYQYKEQIAVIEVDLSQLEEQRKDQLKRVALVEGEKNGLEKLKLEAVAFLDLENHISVVKNKIMQKYRLDVSTSKASLEGELNGVKDNLEEKLTGQREIEAQILEAKKNKEQKSRELKVANDKAEQLQSQFAEIDEQDVKHRTDVKNAKEGIPKLQKEVETLGKKIEECEKNINEKSEEVSSLEEELKLVEETKRELNEEYTAAMESIDTRHLQEQKEAKSKLLIDKNETTLKCKREVDRAQADLDILNKTRNRLRKQKEDTQAAADKIRQDLEAKTEELATLPDEVKNLTSSVTSNRKELEKLISSEKSYDIQFQGVRGDLETARSSFRQDQSRGKQITALMKEKELGKLPGIVGRLGDLGSIDEQFDVAISTACPQLDYIVVDNMNTAKQCVQLLKQRSLGMATFLGLDKMQDQLRNSQRPIQVPRGTVRLFDQIKMKNPEHAGAFYYAARDTLVAQTIDEARRVALHGSQRWRVVTVGGQLIEISGTMSGGGSRVARGLMSNKTTEEFSPAQITSLEKQEGELREKLQSIRQQRADLDATLEKDQQSLALKKNSLQQIDQKIKLLKDQLSSYEMRVKKTEAEMKAAEPDPQEAKRIESTIQSLTKEYEKAEAVSSKVKQEVEDLNAKILEEANKVLGPIKERQQTCDHNKQMMTTQLTKAKTSVKTNEKILKKMQSQVEQNKQEIERLTGVKSNLKALLLQSEKEANQVLQNIELCQVEQKELEKCIDGFNKEIAQIGKGLDEVKQANLALQHQCDELAAKVKDKAAQVVSYNKQIAGLRLNVEDCEACELQTFSEEELVNVNVNALKEDLESSESALKSMKPNLASIVAFRKKFAQYMERVDELDKMTSSRDEKKSELSGLKTRRQGEFMTGLSVIVKKLKEMYQMITLGGDAELELVDSLDPFSEGVVFSVRPLKKSWKNICNLSGGEKTLSSLALVFALHHYKPTPFYFMDEIDAALDYKNVSIISNYIQGRTADAQFIIISLRSQMFELSDQLVGIYKTNNSTKSVSLNHKATMQSICDHTSGRGVSSNKEPRKEQKRKENDGKSVEDNAAEMAMET